MFDTKEQIKVKLYKIISEQFAVKPENITPEMRFREELFADSLDIMELCDVLEGQFDIPTITEDKIATIHKINDLIILIAPYFSDDRE